MNEVTQQIELTLIILIIWCVIINHHMNALNQRATVRLPMDIRGKFYIM